MTRQLSAIVFAASFNFVCGAACAAPLRLCFEDIVQRPWTMPDGSGLHVELLKRVQSQLGESFVLLSKPWKRCQEEVRNGEVDGFFGASSSLSRREYSVFPSLDDGTEDITRALSYERHYVYLRKNGFGSWNGRELISRQRAVLVPRGYYTAELLRERGILVDESIKSAEEGLLRLSQNKADVAILRESEAEVLASSDPRFKNSVIRSSLPYDKFYLYLAIGKAVYVRDPKRIESIWSAIRAERNSEEYRKQVEVARGR